MNKKDFEYDVAFSFLEEDEAIAIKIADLIKDRVKVFIYSEQQKELVGTDGVESFSNIFKEKSRMVVVLYRSKWGYTKWTKIEETAIRNRGYEEGFEFVLFVPLADSTKLPTWMPQTRIWYSWEKWGLEALGPIVENRIQTLCGVIKPKTILDRVAQFEKELAFKEKREKWFASQQGVSEARDAVNEFFKKLEAIAVNITEENSIFRIQTENDGRGNLVLFSNGFSLVLNWQCANGNTLDSSGLYLRIFKGRVTMRPGHMVFEEPVLIYETVFSADLNSDLQVEWGENGVSRKQKSKNLAEYCLDKLIENIKNHKEDNDQYY